MVTETNFDHHNVQQPNFSIAKPCNDQKFTTIENFDYWCEMQNEGFWKNRTCTPFLMTKNMMSPSNIGNLLYGNQIFSVAIWHTPPLDGDWKDSFIERGVGMCYHFGKNNTWLPFSGTKTI